MKNKKKNKLKSNSTVALSMIAVAWIVLGWVLFSWNVSQSTDWNTWKEIAFTTQSSVCENDCEKEYEMCWRKAMDAFNESVKNVNNVNEYHAAVQTAQLEIEECRVAKSLCLLDCIDWEKTEETIRLEYIVCMEEATVEFNTCMAQIPSFSWPRQSGKHNDQRVACIEAFFESREECVATFEKDMSEL